MKKFLLLLIIPFNIACSQQNDYIAKAKIILEQIRNREFSKVTAEFDTNISSRIDTSRLKMTWDKLSPLVGPFVNVIKITTDTAGPDHVVIQHLQFEKRKIDFKLVFGPKGKVKVITFLPDSQREKYNLPDYYKPELITDTTLTLQNGPFRLPGILSRPNKNGRFPLVILVHGTGRNDKDETVGPMKIFKDIAYGLASKDVAVYRYEKRTRVYPVAATLNKKMTIYDETIDDVVANIKMLKSDPNIDTTAIYLAGHGMGGMILPRIAKNHPEIKGLIYLGSNARPLEDVIYDQTAYVLSFDTTISDRKAFLDSMFKESQKIKMLQKSDNDSSYIFRLPASYWADMNKYNPVKSAQELNTPMLFIFGERDYQVTDVDINLWKGGLKSPNVKFNIYPDLNHFFITGKGKSIPAEYGKSGNVDINVINDIAAWILSAKKQ